ncbi:fungal hydrophobin [Paecilomyces variotii]|nr:fungal hydrophobin [Paecilomyces variotii]
MRFGSILAIPLLGSVPVFGAAVNDVTKRGHHNKDCVAPGGGHVKIVKVIIVDPVYISTYCESNTVLTIYNDITYSVTNAPTTVIVNTYVTSTTTITTTETETDTETVIAAPTISPSTGASQVVNSWTNTAVGTSTGAPPAVNSWTNTAAGTSTGAPPAVNSWTNTAAGTSTGAPPAVNSWTNTAAGTSTSAPPAVNSETNTVPGTTYPASSSTPVYTPVPSSSPGPIRYPVNSTITVQQGQTVCGDNTVLSCCNKATYAGDTTNLDSGILGGALSDLLGGGSGSEGLGLFDQCSKLPLDLNVIGVGLQDSLSSQCQQNVACCQNSPSESTGLIAISLPCIALGSLL